MKKKNLLLIFTRNPVLGKCKTRLAAAIGDHGALEVYKILLGHTVSITKKLQVTKEVHYSMHIEKQDIWDDTIYCKKQQLGGDLGKRMEYAFSNGFAEGYKNIIIIGSDIYDLKQDGIERAFQALETHEYVIGPAEDGGYYLLGMNTMDTAIFRNKQWGTNSVLNDTLKDLKNKKIKVLEELNDIDYVEDILSYKIFKPFIKNKKLIL